MPEYIFSDKDETLHMLSGAYKKLKSYLHFNKTLLFAKKKIAIFESDRNNFENSLIKIAESLSDKNEDYFQCLIDKIDFRILPKKFTSADVCSDVIQGTADHNQTISKVNFFIDLPTELQILDFLWTLFIGKLMSEIPHAFKYSAATKFKKSLFTSDKDLNKGIDYESNRSFEPYYQLYSQWRKGAFDKINLSRSSIDTFLMCLDLKSFYYSVEFEFNTVCSFFNNDERLESFEFLTTIIQRIYFTYTRIISKYKKGIRNKEKTCIFPIGATSALVLREIYLNQFDNQIASLQPLYYSRYVDDILLLLPSANNNFSSKEEIVQNYLIDSGIATATGHQELVFKEYNNIRIQKEKVNCFAFPKNKNTVLLDIYAAAIDMNSSEANLLPDIDLLNSSFMQHAYNIQNFELGNKIRDLGFLQNNNYNATRFISSLQRIIKNTIVDDKVFQDFGEQIDEFYSGSQSIEFSNNWRSIFELYLLAGAKDRANNFYKKAKEQIGWLHFENLNSDEVLAKKKGVLLSRLKRDLNENLFIAASLATALDYNFAKNGQIRRLAQSFRESNLLNHTMVSYALLNYSRTQGVTLTECNLASLFKYPNNVFELDKFKLKWSPRYIHSIEFFIANFLYSFNDKEKNSNPPNTVFNKFAKYNHLNFNFSNHFNLTPLQQKGTESYLLKLDNNLQINPKIALVNTKISEKDVLNGVLNPHTNLTVSNKQLLFKILNTAKEQKVNILVFPEFYFPAQWLMDIALFAIRSNISIVTGLQYLTIGNKAFNNVCSIIPSRIGRRFITGLLLSREKNFYAPKERVALSQIGFICSDAKTPLYHIIDNGRYKYSTILCYEFTDIVSRANMKSQIEILFVPQLNKDTNYFSAIVEASARDLHAFIVQANTSKYGDSRITAPYKTQLKNILQIKGGETDVVMIADLKIEELLKKRNNYSSALESIIEHCLNCKWPLSKRPQNCIKCKYNLKDDLIKGTPPNF